MTQHSLTPDDLDYALPEHLIATHPAQPRDAARMMVVHRSHEAIEHRRVTDLPDYLRAGDLLMFNDTAVLPARLIGRRQDTGGRVEGLFLHDGADPDKGPPTWLIMLRSNGRLRTGQTINLLDARGDTCGFDLVLIEKRDECWRAVLQGAESSTAALEQVGLTPLPPYILRARGEQAYRDADDRSWYQTVYADPRHRRSVAAPTAGLHFTPNLMDALDRQGVRRKHITLHVGAGTFKPVTAPTLKQHHMHRESFEVPAAALDAIRDVRQDPSARLIAVGTTTVRALESLPTNLETGPDKVSYSSVIGETDLLIAPPYSFRHVEGMLTNFHLPRSTLLALVATMVGLNRVRELYAEAVREEYRFYSYGDAMLILP